MYTFGDLTGRMFSLEGCEYVFDSSEAVVEYLKQIWGVDETKCKAVSFNVEPLAFRGMGKDVWRFKFDDHEAIAIAHVVISKPNVGVLINSPSKGLTGKPSWL